MSLNSEWEFLYPVGCMDNEGVSYTATKILSTLRRGGLVLAGLCHRAFSTIVERYTNAPFR